MSANLIETRLNAKADALLQRRVNKILLNCMSELDAIITGFRVGNQPVSIDDSVTTATVDIQEALTAVAMAARGHLTAPARAAFIDRFIARAEQIIDEETAP